MDSRVTVMRTLTCTLEKARDCGCSNDHITSLTICTSDNVNAFFLAVAQCMGKWLYHPAQQVSTADRQS